MDGNERGSKINTINSNYILRRLFAGKYLKLALNPPGLNDVAQREFAFFFFDKNYMIRHMGFGDPILLWDYIKSKAPRHVYTSAALYRYPDKKNMSDKEWLGCDFTVDIDADHMDLPCSKEHDYYFCADPENKGCSFMGKGKPPKECPECGGAKFRKQPWLCDKCLEATKKEIIKLMEFFTDDFGIPEDEIEIKFSGHRGYHFSVRNEKIRKLGSEERRIIVDYLECNGFNPPDSYRTAGSTFYGASPDTPGIRGRIARTFLKLLEEGNKEQFFTKWKPSGLSNGIIQILYDYRDELTAEIKRGSANWSGKIKRKGLGTKTWEKILKFLLHKVACEIDEPVAIDIHRLIRLAGTIHGKTGFIVKPLEPYELEAFDPLSDAVIFNTGKKSGLWVRITSEAVPPFRIGDEEYPGYTKGRVILLPVAAAVFLVAKGTAEFTAVKRG